MTDKDRISATLKKFSTAKILCIGDIMLDKFIYGSVERISPEAPIPVLLINREKHMLGGAGNVVANIASLGVKASIISAISDDNAGKDIKKQLEDLSVDYVLEKFLDRNTTVKSRFICGPQQILRADNEKKSQISKTLEDKIIEQAKKLIPQTNVVILSDYKKGVLTDNLISKIIEISNNHNKTIIIDPKGSDFSKYNGATIITPNRKELEAATNMPTNTDNEIEMAAKKIIKENNIKTIVATRSKDGMTLISEEETLHIASESREVYDVSGAGDTVIASFAAAIASGASFKDSAVIANIAGGIVVGKAGTATVTIDDIKFILEKDSIIKRIQNSKLVTRKKAAEQAELLKIKGQKLGFANGCFDLLHPGHISLLRQSKAACDFLVVGLNSDSSIKKLKGSSRPIQTQAMRAEILSALEMVDMIVIFEEESVFETIKAIKPDVLIKGGQYNLEEIVGYDFVISYGGKVVRAEMEDGFSTTETISKISA